MNSEQNNIDDGVPRALSDAARRLVRSGRAMVVGQALWACVALMIDQRVMAAMWALSALSYWAGTRVVLWLSDVIVDLCSWLALDRCMIEQLQTELDAERGKP